MAATNNSRSGRISGDEERELDPRNRLILSTYREQLGNSFVFALTDWGSVCAYPTAVWEKKFEELDNYSPNSPGRSTYMRMLFECCEEDVKFEQGGRVTIPAKLREKGNLKGEVCLRGKGEWLELWNPEELKKFEADEAGYNPERQAKKDKAYEAMIASPKIR